MGWGVMVDGVYLSKKHTSELRDLFRENEELITVLHKRILLLAAGTPRDVALESNHIIPWEEYIREYIDCCMENIQKAAGQNFVIGQILEDPEGTVAKDT